MRNNFKGQFFLGTCVLNVKVIVFTSFVFNKAHFSGDAG